MKCPVLYLDVFMVPCGGSGSLSQMCWLAEVASELGAGLESRDSSDTQALEPDSQPSPWLLSYHCPRRALLSFGSPPAFTGPSASPWLAHRGREHPGQSRFAYKRKLLKLQWLTVLGMVTEVEPYWIQVVCRCGQLSIHLFNFMDT